MKNENQMEMQIHTTQTNSHMHAMGGKLHIPHILNHISTHTHHPHPPSLSSCSHCSSCETGPLEFCICICISPATCQIRLKAEGLASACKWMCSIFQQIRTTFELFGHCVNIPDPINPKQPMHRWSSAFHLSFKAPLPLFACFAFIWPVGQYENPKMKYSKCLDERNPIHHPLKIQNPNPPIHRPTSHPFRPCLPSKYWRNSWPEIVSQALAN